MYVKITRTSAKREVQKERSAQRDDQIARPRRAQTCERSELRAMSMCPRSGQIFFLLIELMFFRQFDKLNSVILLLAEILNLFQSKLTAIKFSLFKINL